MVLAGYAVTVADLASVTRLPKAAVSAVPKRLPLDWFAVLVVSALVVVELAAVAVLVIGPSPLWDFGMDWRFYRDLGRTWLATGDVYRPYQLSGPFVITTMVDNLYPPHSLLLFVPFSLLPDAFWWIAPLGVLAYVLVAARPPAWAWLVILGLFAWPRSISAVLLGNTDMWIAAFVGAGTRWGWPALLVSMKPSLAIFMVLGVRSPRVSLACLALVGLTVLIASDLWAQYVIVVSNVVTDPWYSLGSVPFIVIPLVAAGGAWVERNHASKTRQLRALRPLPECVHVAWTRSTRKPRQ